LMGAAPWIFGRPLGHGLDQPASEPEVCTSQMCGVGYIVLVSHTYRWNELISCAAALSVQAVRTLAAQLLCACSCSCRAVRSREQREGGVDARLHQPRLVALECCKHLLGLSKGVYLGVGFSLHVGAVVPQHGQAVYLGIADGIVHVDGAKAAAGGVVRVGPGVVSGTAGFKHACVHTVAQVRRCVGGCPTPHPRSHWNTTIVRGQLG
jgi:hypothetical protein